MRSTRFSCERALFKKDLTRFWPLWAAYTLLWFLLVPMYLFGQGADLARSYVRLGLTGWAGDLAMQFMCGAGGIAAGAVYGVLCAMAVWSYLFNARPVNLTHALPVRREGQFAAHYLSGTAFFVLPHAVIAVLTLAAGLATGSRGDLGRIAAAVGILTLLCLFFFSLATFCAFVTGHILALPALYLVANFLAYALSNLLDWLFRRFLFGVTSTLANSPAVEWLFPLKRLPGSLRFRFSYDYGGSLSAHYADSVSGIPMPEDGFPDGLTFTRCVEGLDVLLIYTAVGVVLAALALLLYRRRNLESAGDVIAVGWLRPVFQYGVALCAALAGTWLTQDILNADGPVVIALLLAVWGVIGCFAAKMLLNKTLRVFKTGWKGAAVTAAALLVLCGGLWTDLFGLERRLPDPAQVESVWLRGPESVPVDSADGPIVDVSDPAVVEKIIAVHRAVVDNRREQKALSGTVLPEGMRRNQFSVTYRLKNGSYLERRYDLALDLAQGEDPESLAGAVNALIRDRGFVRTAYELDGVDPGRFTEVQVQGLSDGKGSCPSLYFYTPLSDYAAEQAEVFIEGEYAVGGSVPIAEAYTKFERELDLRPVTAAELGRLWRAVLADFDAGTLGSRWLNWTDAGCEENVTTATLQFQWQQKAEDRDYYYTRQMTVQLDRRAENTWRALEELGVFDGGVYVETVAGERLFPQS